MKSEKILPQEDKFKYIINGEIRYFTEEEFLEYIRSVCKKTYKEFLNMEISEEEIIKTAQTIRERIAQYDGDPYGHIKESKPNNYAICHMAQAAGVFYIQKSIHSLNVKDR